ncbi:MAG TPA: VOC family protein [Terracidiphilus sp.]|nr:VOC family protein [Terracidiphilus sp.]
MADSVSTSKRVETTLTTMLYVRRSAAALDFYLRAFGATSIERMDNEDGSVIAHLDVGNGDFWVSEESPVHQNFSPESLGGSTMHMVLIVDDPHTLFDQAIAAGATSISPVRDESYGWRIGRVLDPFGHHWEIGKDLSER